MDNCKKCGAIYKGGLTVGGATTHRKWTCDSELKGAKFVQSDKCRIKELETRVEELEGELAARGEHE